MAARKRRFHTQREREAIRTSQLINRLTGFIFGTLDPQTGRPIEMTAGQVRVALEVLRKTLPDLQSVRMDAELHHQSRGKDLATLE